MNFHEWEVVRRSLLHSGSCYAPGVLQVHPIPVKDTVHIVEPSLWSCPSCGMTNDSTMLLCGEGRPWGCGTPRPVHQPPKPVRREGMYKGIPISQLSDEDRGEYEEFRKTLAFSSGSGRAWFLRGE